MILLVASNLRGADLVDVVGYSDSYLSEKLRHRTDLEYRRHSHKEARRHLDLNNVGFTSGA